MRLDAHPHAQAVLGSALAARTPSHAYLFAGPAGSGKRAAARDFAAELLSEGAADPEAARARVRTGAHVEFKNARRGGAVICSRWPRDRLEAPPADDL